MTINDPFPKNALLVDLRDKEDYQAGHLPGAVNLSLPEMMGETDRNRPILLYCYRGIRSLKAAIMLKKAGYTNVHSLGGVNKYRGKMMP